MSQLSRTAQQVFEEARIDLRKAIYDALEKVKQETGLQPSALDISVDIISSGPQFEKPEELFLGDVRVEFKV